MKSVPADCSVTPLLENVVVNDPSDFTQFIVGNVMVFPPKFTQSSCNLLKVPDAGQPVIASVILPVAVIR
jgi:hypothetical protein